MKKIILLIIFLIPFNIKALEVSARSAILMDADSKRILYSKNIHEKRSVASISKIMTALLVIEKGRLNKKVIVGDEIDKAYGSNVYIKKGEKLKIVDLLYGLMLRSGNDASYTLAKNTYGSVENFVKKMNEKANVLKLNDTEFNNPNGLDEEKANYSSAYDMAIIMREALKYDEFKKIINTKKYTLKTNLNTYIWKNKNKLLSMYKGAIGGKTGFTKKAKRTLVNAASKDNLNLIAVTLNDPNDFKDHKSLFEYGFNNYKKYEILKKGIIEIDSESYYKNYSFYIKKSFNYPLTKEENELIKLKFNLKKERKLKDNKKVGKVEVYLGEIKIHEENIYIKRNHKFRLRDLFGK